MELPVVRDVLAARVRGEQVVVVVVVGGDELLAARDLHRGLALVREVSLGHDLDIGHAAVGHEAGPGVQTCSAVTIPSAEMVTVTITTQH